MYDYLKVVFLFFSYRSGFFFVFLLLTVAMNSCIVNGCLFHEFFRVDSSNDKVSIK